MHYEFKKEDAFAFANHVHIQAKQKDAELMFQYCPYCRGGNNGKDKGTFSINVNTGMFKCLRASCGQQGFIWRLAKDFDFKLTDDFSRYYEKKPKYKRLPQPKKKVEPREEAISYLAGRGISEATARAYEVTVKNDNPDVLCFPVFKDDGTLVNIKYRNTKFVKGESNGNKEWFEKGCEPYLYGVNTWNGKYDRMVLTEGQMDALACYEAGIENSFSVLGGKNAFTWFPACYDFISKFDELIVFGDFENGNITLLDDMRVRFQKRIRHVRFEDYRDCKDANELLIKYGKEHLQECIKNSICIPMKQIIDLSDVEDVDVFKIQKLETGIKSIDKLLYGGIPFGGVTLISGKAGEGKLLADDTPVFTRNGWKNHGDLVVGDEVVGRNGEWVKVTHIFPKYFANMKITMQNKEEIFCHENHEWVTIFPCESGYKEKIFSAKELYDKKINGYTHSIRLIDRKPLEGEKISKGNTVIEKIEYCEHKRGNCIEVEGGIYCVGKSMIPTHNSTLASQIISHAIFKGHKCFCYSGELPNYLFKQWLSMQVAGSNHIFEYSNRWGDVQYGLSEANKQMINNWYRGKIMLFDNSAIDGDERESLCKTVEKVIVQYGADVILLDNLMTAINLEERMGSSEYEVQSNFLLKLTRIALRYNVCIMLVAHKRKNNYSTNENDEIMGSSNIVNLAMLTIAYEKSEKVDPKQRLCKISKNRLFGRTDTSGFILDYDEKSKRIYGNGDDKDFEYNWDFDYENEIKKVVNFEVTTEDDDNPFV